MAEKPTCIGILNDIESRGKYNYRAVKFYNKVGKEYKSVNTTYYTDEGCTTAVNGTNGTNINYNSKIYVLTKDPFIIGHRKGHTTHKFDVCKLSDEATPTYKGGEDASMVWNGAKRWFRLSDCEADEA